MAFDHRFIPLATFRNNPLFVALVYCPTAFFAILALLRLRHGQLLPLAAFAIGLIATGLFHQSLIAETYGDPGYMIPIGHFAAPIVSAAAYTTSLLAARTAGRVLQGKRETDSGGD